MRVIAFDTETYLISYPDQVNPRGVCISVARRQANGVTKTALMKFDDSAHVMIKEWLRCPNTTLVGHNVAFDLHVMAGMWPDLIPLIWQAFKDRRIGDTQLRAKLYMLSTEGIISPGTSLAGLVDMYFGREVVGKSGEDVWRMRYAELENIPLPEWPVEAQEYAINDALETLRVYEYQESVKSDSGPGSIKTEALQVAAAYSLRGMEIEGILVDQDKVAALKQEYGDRHALALAELKAHGLVRENGSRDTKAIAQMVEELGVTERTDTGRIKMDRKTLEAVVSDDLRYKALMEYSNTLKAVSTFIPQMEYDKIHPNFNPMVNTLRTSCMSSNYYKYQGKEYGKKVIKRGHALPSMNFQQIPRDADFRDCFTASPGCVFLTLDYCNLELVCAAQLYYNLFGESKMREVLNTGANLHDETGCLIFNTLEEHQHSKQSKKPYRAITTKQFKTLISENVKQAKFARQAAKFVNLGCPGGQSAETIYKLARLQGMDITLEDAETWREQARGKYPEFDKFFGLRECRGWMHTQKVYQGDFPYCVDAWGIYLARKSYTAFANAISMQTPGAIGVKRSLVKLYNACQNPEANSSLFGCSLKALVHDEFVLEVPADRWRECLEEMALLMLEGMGSVVPDVRLEVEACVQSRWGKEPNGPCAHEEKFHKKERQPIGRR